jgi:hypothetical protein
MAVADHERVRGLAYKRAQCLGINVHRSRLVDHDDSPVTGHLMSESPTLIVSEEPARIAHGSPRRTRPPRSITLPTLPTLRAFEEYRLVYHEWREDARRRATTADRERSTKGAKFVRAGRYTGGR